MLSAIAPFAVSYIQGRVCSSGWVGGITFNWLHALANLPQRYVPGVAKFAMLRWALGEDDDLGLEVRISLHFQ